MRADIHPEYNKVQVSCTCGNQFEIGSVLSEDTLSIEVCNKCHPFYTGKQKIIDTAGRVDSFYRKFGGFGKSAKSATSDNAAE